MSKLINRNPIRSGAVFLASTVLLIACLSSAAVSQTATSARQAAIIRTTAEVLDETSKIRELAIRRPVKSGAQSRVQIQSMLVKKLDQQMTTAHMHAVEVSLKKFGLVAPDFQYRVFIIKLLTEQVAGYYDTKGQRFQLADWLELDGQKPVMSHELTHALQDQHFNLRRFEKWPRGDSDAGLAAHALIEGDATLAMTLYMSRHPLIALAFIQSLKGENGLALEQYNQAPRVLRDTLTFPYVQGMEWAAQLYKRGGWPMVSKAYTRLPLSTEQILHPEKYFSYERPVKITLRDLTALLNPRRVMRAGNRPLTTGHRAQRPAHRPLPTNSWRRIESDVNGEWGYFLILDQFLNSPEESRRAAAGWAGDRFALYEGPNGQVFLAQVTLWDTAEDARDFFNAYAKRTALRYPDAQALSDAVSENRRLWKAKEGSLIIERSGLRVVIVEGLPEASEVNAIMRALSQ